MAEQWRQRQWNNQIQQQTIQNRRYDDEQARLRSDRLNKAMAMTNLRKDFLSRYGGQDLSGYGLGAQFAMSRIQNPASYEDLVGAGQSLASIIAQQDMINAQRAEQAQANMGQNYSLGLNTRLGLMGFDPNRPEQSVAAVPTTEGGNELQGYLNIDIILGPFKIHDLVIQGLFAPVQVSHEFPDAAFIAEGMLTDFLFFLFFSRTS